jgi:translation elongation factor EF-G
MDILPIAPLRISVTSPSRAIAKELYGIVDASLAKLPSTCCELSDGRVVVGALTERNLASAITLARTQIYDLKLGQIEVTYIDDPYPQEPYYRVAVTTPADYVGDVVGDLNRRVGCIETMDYFDGGVTVKCGVPIATMIGYDQDLELITSGRGKAEYAFIGYYRRTRQPEPPLPPAVAARA